MDHDTLLNLLRALFAVLFLELALPKGTTYPRRLLVLVVLIVLLNLYAAH